MLFLCFVVLHICSGLALDQISFCFGCSILLWLLFILLLLVLLSDYAAAVAAMVAAMSLFVL